METNQKDQPIGWAYNKGSKHVISKSEQNNGKMSYCIVACTRLINAKTKEKRGKELEAQLVERVIH